MQIKYINSTIENKKKLDENDDEILKIISSLPAFNVIFNKEILNETIKTIKKFELNKRRIVLFGTGGSSLGARALNNVINNKKITIEFYDNIDPISFEKSFENIDFKSTGFIIISK